MRLEVQITRDRGRLAATNWTEGTAPLRSKWPASLRGASDFAVVPLNRCDLESQASAVPNRSARLSVLFLLLLLSFLTAVNTAHQSLLSSSPRFQCRAVGRVWTTWTPSRGRVIGVRPEQRIVLYAKSGGRWWIQPFASRTRYSPKSKGIPNGRM